VTYLSTFQLARLRLLVQEHEGRIANQTSTSNYGTFKTLVDKSNKAHKEYIIGVVVKSCVLAAAGEQGIANIIWDYYGKFDIDVDIDKEYIRKVAKARKPNRPQ
jgi:hypothetical protein